MDRIRLIALFGKPGAGKRHILKYIADNYDVNVVKDNTIDNTQFKLDKVNVGIYDVDTIDYLATKGGCDELFPVLINAKDKTCIFTVLHNYNEQEDDIVAFLSALLKEITKFKTNFSKSSFEFSVVNNHDHNDEAEISVSKLCNRIGV